MQLYLLNASFQAISVVDVFQSVIWTERYADAGDVLLVVSASQKNKETIKENLFFSLEGSTEVMLIESVVEEDNKLTVTGTSLTGFFAHRMVRPTWSTAQSSWNKTGVPAQIALDVVKAMCIDPAGPMAAGSVLPSGLGVGEIIPGLSISTSPGGTSDSIAIPYGSLYDAVKAICDGDDLGFVIQRIGDTGALFMFKVYRGKDLTSTQTTNKVVVFEPALDTLTDVKGIRSIAGYKTHAYAWANGMTAQSSIGVAIAAGASGFTGWQRRTLMVEATDVTASDYTASALKTVLDRKAKDALINNNYVRMTDGKLVPQTSFVYGFDYSLGDVIELRGTSSIAQPARITEYIRSQDSTGEHKYPTLSVID